MNRLYYLFAAYTIFWIGISVYLFTISNRIDGLKKEISRLTDLCKER